jgi:aspartate ammonia-lyase
MASPATDAQFAQSIRTTDPSVDTRIEWDSLGEVAVPAQAYWGVNTSRALTNFAISGRPISEFPDLIAAFAQVKQAAARANAEIGSLAPERADLIDRACRDILAGELLEQFPVDIMQGGAGTSTNMNVNEVIANRGLELAGRGRGEYEHLSPNDDVNCSQSTNDTYPTACKLALRSSLERLLGEMVRLEASLSAKGEEFAEVVKVGRTQLQDAVPMTVGQEFHGFATVVRLARTALAQVEPLLLTISLGATAIGTGIAADPRYAEAVCRHLREITGLHVVTADDLVAATSDMGAFLQLSGGLKRFAMQLSKICNDLRLLSSGPQAGLGEIRLPPRQAGSSIMPGKVNPVICEVVNEVCFMVAGADVVVAMASEAGQLQLNAFEPVILQALLMSEKWLTAALITLRENCIDGITVNEAHLAAQSGSFVGVITMLIPYIGYSTAARLAKQGLATGQNVTDLVVEAGLMERTDVETLLQPARLAGTDTSLPALSRDYAHERRFRE